MRIRELVKIMRNPIKIIVRDCKDWYNIASQLRSQRGYQVRFYNVWDGQTHDEMYWYRFLRAKGLLDSGKTIAFFSCFGPREIIDYVSSDVKVFVSGENLMDAHYTTYTDHYLVKKELDLSMGLEVLDDARYIRFPIWMDYMFSPESTEADIRTKCKELRFPKIKGKKKFCCMVASNAANGLRDEMYDSISKVAHVDSAGKHLHNDDSLKKEFGDIKIDYMKQYVFNICPENTFAYGYTTEKLFEAILCGCIPIYWGAEFADKEVINEDVIIRWDKGDGGASAVRKVWELYDNPKMLQEFMAQPRLKPTAEEYILDTFASIESKLRKLIED